MLNGALARRYAQALFELAVEGSALEQVDSELRELADVIEKNTELKYLLNHPNIELDDKKEILQKVFGESVSQLTQHFLYLLVDRRRQNLVSLIQREFSKMADEARQIVEAKVTSAVALSDGQTDELKQALGKMTGKNIRLLTQVDSGLIGGAKVQVGDRVMDGSIAAALRKMRRELKKTS